MEKVERNLIEPIGEVNFERTHLDLSKGVKKFQLKLENFFIRKGFLLLMIGFLLGRALILAKLTPFCLPFFAAVFFIRRDKAPIALIGLIEGAATISIVQASHTFFTI